VLRLIANRFVMRGYLECYIEDMKPMAKRLVTKALVRHGCIKLRDTGSHEKWGCPAACGAHTTAVPRHGQITAGVVRNLIADLECLPKGWLQ
jgi:predicted RNA binding protein YcfA (HicA-like mRNA interferase family)